MSVGQIILKKDAIVKARDGWSNMDFVSAFTLGDYAK